MKGLPCSERRKEGGERGAYVENPLRALRIPTEYLLYRDSPSAFLQADNNHKGITIIIIGGLL